MTALAARAPSSVPWYDDLCSCLQVDIGWVLEREGWDPVRAVASGWRFVAPPAEVEPVEYFHPATEALDLAICLHHPVRMCWHEPASEEAAHRSVVAALGRGVAPIVAVNNFHLPFRPAYHDVHAAHLVIVTGWDDGRGAYRLVDPMPPAFSGELPREVVARARAELVVGDDSDPFFAGRRPAWRWLEVRVEGPQPALTLPWLRTVLEGNLAALRGPGQGLAALRRVLEALPESIARRGEPALRDVYVLGWHAQAEAALHATFLAAAASALARPELAEAARWVDRVAHAWTGFRVAAAHADPGEPADLRRVLRLSEELTLTWESCLRRLETVVRGLA